MAQGPLIAPGDIIVESWLNFRKNVKTYAEFVVWVALLSVVQWAFSAILKTAVDDRFMRLTILALVSLPILFLVAVLTTSMMDFTAKTLRGKKTDLKEMLSVGIHKVFPVIWVTVLVGLMYLLGLILLVIPMFVFLVWYRFSQAFVVVDDVRGGAAMAASKKLSSGRWWAVFARIAVPGLFFYVAAAFATALAYLLFGAALGDPGLFFGNQPDIGELSNTHTLITSVVPNIINAFALPLFMGADLILWFDLKRTA
ncbi:MAG TPA: hypothetical protein VJ694_03425 [Patescibacteria group bacterium]|nr:hypothetical protein [Patescibacteria group bacterium]